MFFKSMMRGKGRKNGLKMDIQVMEKWLKSQKCGLKNYCF